MTEVISNDYEVSSEGCVRHWEIPYARLEDVTPTVSNPASVRNLVATGNGIQVCGTILSIDATNNVAVIDFTPSMVYRQPLRNVSGYNLNVAENAWLAIQLGAAVYYDRSASMPAGCYLSLCATDLTGANNPLFGYVVGWSDADMASFPKAAAGVGSTTDCAIMQRGAGA
jgi:hypothetical protein